LYVFVLYHFFSNPLLQLCQFNWTGLLNFELANVIFHNFMTQSDMFSQNIGAQNVGI
jgi:hypothetical protein